MKGATGNIYNGLSDFEEMGFLLHYLDEHDLFLDVGANVGAYTILVAVECGSSVISIEPIPKTFSYLNDNIKINNVGHLIQTFNVGVAAFNGVLNFSVENDTMNRVVLDSQFIGETQKIEVVKLSEILLSKVPSVIKIDVEGYEYDILKASQEILTNSNLNVLIIETNDLSETYDICTDELLSLIKQCGFNSVAYDPYIRAVNYCAPKKNGNTIFIKDLNLVKKKISVNKRTLIDGRYI